MISGNNQRVNATRSTNALVVQAVDGSGTGFSGVSVTFLIVVAPSGSSDHTLTPGGGTSVVVVTDVNGLASVVLNCGSVEGKYQVNATAAGLIGSLQVFTIASTPMWAILQISDIKPSLKIAANETSQDDLLQDYINIASNTIERYTRGPVNVQTYDGEIYDGNGKDKLYLRNWPIVQKLRGDLTDVQYRILPTDLWQNLETIDANYIMLKPQEPWALFLFARTFFKGKANIKIAYKAGYTVVPGEIKQVCRERVIIMFQESFIGDQRLGKKSHGVSDGKGHSTISYDDLSERHRQILARYVKTPLVEETKWSYR